MHNIASFSFSFCQTTIQKKVHRIASQPQRKKKWLIVMNCVSFLTTMTTKNMETVTKISTDNVAEIKLKFMLIDRKMRCCTFVDQDVDWSKYVHTNPISWCKCWNSLQWNYFNRVEYRAKFTGWNKANATRTRVFITLPVERNFCGVQTKEEYSNFFKALTRSNHLVTWYNKMRKTKTKKRSNNE